jgi:acyl carrier protein
VVARPDATGETVLCAYCIAAPGAALDARVLREHLSTTLPTFMIPSHLLQVDAFPLSPNGKVDIAALPLPERTAQDGGGGPPRTHYELRVAEHWTQLLGVPSVGLDHDFFELGGSSIKLIELIYRLQSELDIAISVSQLFKVSTLVGMARAVEDVARGRDAGDQPYLRFNTGQGNTIYCFPPAGGHGLVYRRLAEHMPEHAFVSFNYLAGENKVERYADLIDSIQNEGPCVLFGYSLGGNLAFEVAKELERRGREVPNVVIMDSYRIKESFELTDLHLVEFERDLRAHLRKHTGSDVVERVTLDQAKEYIHFCNRVLNSGVITAPVSIISDEDKAENYEVGHYGTWHGSSATRTAVFRGHGKHADMLDGAYVARNAAIARSILDGGVS